MAPARSEGEGRATRGPQPRAKWIYGARELARAPRLEGGESSEDAEIMDEAFRDMRAVVMGRRMFDLGEGPWGEKPPFRAPVSSW